MTNFLDALRAGADELGLDLTDGEARACDLHFQSVLRWNKVHNLTRVTSPTDAARRHYLDALCGFELLQSRLEEGERLRAVDVGSGAGYPGVIGAIRWPSCQWTLLDAAAKRCSFLKLVLAEMKVDNVDVLHADARKVEARWPLVVSRATFSSPQLDAARALIAPGGKAGLWIGNSDVDKCRIDDGEVLQLGATRVFLG